MKPMCSKKYSAGRFGIETADYGKDGNIYRAFGPFGMRGSWQEDEQDCCSDTLFMMQQVKLSDEEWEVALAIYEMQNNL